MKKILRWTNIPLWTNEGFCHVWWLLCFVLCSASEWGPSFSLFHGVGAWEHHPCAGWRTCVEVMTTCHTRPDISHTKQKVGQEGEEDKRNDSRQGQRRQRPKWPHLERHLVLDPILCAQPCLWSCLPQDHLRWGQDTNTRTFLLLPLLCAFSPWIEPRELLRHLVKEERRHQEIQWVMAQEQQSEDKNVPRHHRRAHRKGNRRAQRPGHLGRHLWCQASRCSWITQRGQQ